MKNNVNSLAIGMFVLGAALISVITVVVFGASKFFEDDQIFASRFAETVNGLDVGAPVKFKGVKIGKVERIAIASGKISEKDESAGEDLVSVIYSIDLNLLKRRMRDAKGESGVDWVKEQIRAGLRAKLMYQSIVTGMLYIELDYLDKPDKDIAIFETPRFIGIPSVSSGLSELVKSVQDSIASIASIDFKELFANANTLLVNLNSKVEAIDAEKLNDATLKMIADADALMLNANTLVGGAGDFVKNSDKNLAELSSDLRKTLSNVDKLAANVNALVEPNSKLYFELATLIRSLNNSANSFSNLADYIQRNPNSLLTGKKARQHER